MKVVNDPTSPVVLEMELLFYPIATQMNPLRYHWIPIHIKGASERSVLSPHPEGPEPLTDYKPEETISTLTSSASSLSELPRQHHQGSLNISVQHGMSFPIYLFLHVS